jgi:hypothetical protein
VDFDFATLQLIEGNLLQAALAFPGIATAGVSSLRFLLNPVLLGPRFSPISLVKTWVKELKAFKDHGHSSFEDGAGGDTYADLTSEFDKDDPDFSFQSLVIVYNLWFLCNICSLRFRLIYLSKIYWL